MEFLIYVGSLKLSLLGLWCQLPFGGNKSILNFKRDKIKTPVSIETYHFLSTFFKVSTFLLAFWPRITEGLLSNAKCVKCPKFGGGLDEQWTSCCLVQQTLMQDVPWLPELLRVKVTLCLMAWVCYVSSYVSAFQTYMCAHVCGVHRKVSWCLNRVQVSAWIWQPSLQALPTLCIPPCNATAILCNVPDDREIALAKGPWPDPCGVGIIHALQKQLGMYRKVRVFGIL